LLGEFASLVDREDRDFVGILQPDVGHTRHLGSSLKARGAAQNLNP
jgi:hypothetical protein